MQIKEKKTIEVRTMHLFLKKKRNPPINVLKKEIIL